MRLRCQVKIGLKTPNAWRYQGHLDPLMYRDFLFLIERTFQLRMLLSVPVVPDPVVPDPVVPGPTVSVPVVPAPVVPDPVVPGPTVSVPVVPVPVVPDPVVPGPTVSGPVVPGPVVPGPTVPVPTVPVPVVPDPVVPGPTVPVPTVPVPTVPVPVVPVPVVPGPVVPVFVIHVHSYFRGEMKPSGRVFLPQGFASCFSRAASSRRTPYGPCAGNTRAAPLDDRATTPESPCRLPRLHLPSRTSSLRCRCS